MKLVNISFKIKLAYLLTYNFLELINLIFYFASLTVLLRLL